MRNLLAFARIMRVGFVAALVACVSSSNRGGSPLSGDATLAPASSKGSRVLYIGRAELANLGVTTMDEVVLRLRPEWLRANPTWRGTGDARGRASVYTDGIYSGEIDVLRTIPTEVVIDVRYLPPAEARIRYGSGCHCAGGVFLVRTRTDVD